MITIRSPHMALNDNRSPVQAQMWNTFNITSTMTVNHIVGWTAQVARKAPGGKLAEIVILCHGAPAYLQLGTGVGPAQVETFKALRGLVDKVWLRACLVGRIAGGVQTGADKKVMKSMGAADGNKFCQDLAKALGCYVVVGTELQVSSSYSRSKPLPYGKLDSFEGLVLSYDSEGKVTWSHRYPSVYNVSPDGSRATNPNRE